jgi:hypothetical protein
VLKSGHPILRSIIKRPFSNANLGSKAGDLYRYLSCGGLLTINDITIYQISARMSLVARWYDSQIILAMDLGILEVIPDVGKEDHNLVL